MLQQRVPLIVLFMAILTVLIIPLKIMAYGYIPPDDAGRHAAKAVSGKDWQDILVIRGDIKMDSHPGWHFILSSIHKTTKSGADALVVFSVVVLFALFALFPLFLLERPESWIAALLALAVVAPGQLFRLFLGRPYIITMSVILFIGLLWPRLKEGKAGNPVMAAFAVLIALSTWMHGTWYVYILPLACLFLARQWRAGLMFAVSLIAGVFIGSALTGHPFLFIKQIIQHAFLAFNSGPRFLVSEFKPSGGDSLIVMAVFLMLIWRSVRKSTNRRVLDDPVFMLAAVSWVLGFVTLRFWLDIGVPALILWVALEFQEFFEKNADLLSLRRISITLVLSLALYLAVTSDAGSRWTRNLTIEYLSAEDPGQKEWMPEPGGIIYSDSMTLFYQTFFKNPHAPWRYVLGFEPAWMKPEDLEILRRIQWNFGAAQAFAPWISKMGPEDRLIINRPAEQKPQIPGLEWHYAATDIWIGRLSRPGR